MGKVKSFGAGRLQALDKLVKVSVIREHEGLMQGRLAAMFAQKQPAGGLCYLAGGESFQLVRSYLRGQKDKGTGFQWAFYREGFPGAETNTLRLIRVIHTGNAGMYITGPQIRQAR